MMMKKLFAQFSLALCMIAAAGYDEVAAAEDPVELTNKIEKVEFVALSGGRVVVRIHTTEPLKIPPAGFTLNNPPRIALDFLKVGSNLSKSMLSAELGVLKSVNLAQAKERTRMVLNLSKSVAYSTSTSGKETTILLQDKELNAATGDANVTRFAEAKLGDQTHRLTNVDFMRGKNGEGRIMVDLSDAAAGIDLRQQGKTIVIDFINTDIPANLQRRLNVINFNTPVLYVDTMKQGKNTRIVIEPKGKWEQSAYQADKRFIVDVRPIIEDPNKLVQGNKPGYSGEKLSLNFQNIDVRSVLQVIADFTGFNIITSDTVVGNLTLRLKDVPWDQALDIIMQSKGLTQRKTGNVILVAPAEEVMAKEKLALEASQQIDDLEALHTEVFTLNYQKAEALKALLSDEKQKILSKRGSAVVDVRTNTIFVQDTARHLVDVQNIINKIDIRVKQVMIESRLVIADQSFSKQLGARFGVTNTSGNGTVSGTLGNTLTSVSSDGTVTQGTHNGAIQTNTTGSTTTSSDGEPDLITDLAVTDAAGSIAYSFLAGSTLLNLELSALETDNRGKVVSSPRIITANQQKATIEQGTEIPYTTPASAASTTPAIAFKKAVLSLDVTPQITPDNKIIMDLVVKKDSVGTVYSGVPSIDTRNIKTQVLVSNGETAVLGGIYEQTDRNDVTKVPLFGDLPVLGYLFKTTSKQIDKTELLIFITPRIVDENISLQ